MLCPVCKIDLKIADRQGIEIDYCSKCRGVWLDRSELDEIIKRSNAGGSRDNDDEDMDSSDRDRRGNRRRNRDDEDDEEGGFLGNIFGGFGGRDD